MSKLETFWDSSALVALLLQGPHSTAAQGIWSASGRAWCWKWTQVEVEAVLGQRRAQPATWAAWRRVMSAMQWLDLVPGAQPALCQFNRTARLSAPVAAQLFVFDRASAAVHGLQLLSFDRETILAAEMLSMPMVAVE